MFCACIAIIVSGSLRAETVVIESRVALQNGDPGYVEVAGNWQNSSAKSSAAGLTPGTGSRFATAEAAQFHVRPTLQAGGIYLVEVTHGTSSNIPTNLVVGIAQSNCSGLSATTTAFDQNPANVWRTVGTITLDAGQTTPTIAFTRISGDGAGPRFYADAVRFINTADPCLSGLPQLATVNGPLVAGQTFVNVPSVNSNAVKVTVYGDGVRIGELTNGVVSGLNTVPTSQLGKGAQITATQSNPADVESCRSPTGPVVGGGANAAIRVGLSIKEDPTLTGPIGTNAGTPTLPIKMLGATGPTAGFGTAPAGGKVFQPDVCWQTVTFQRGDDPANPIDPTYIWSGTGGNTLDGDFGILDAIAFSIEDLTDSGPFLIYIDNIVNGSTIVQDFESAATGANVIFMPPAFSGSTSPFLLAQPPGSISPNLSVVTNSNADTGTNSLMVHWQFKDTANVNWLRLVAQGPDTPNPQVDLRLPISFRMLLLSVGQTNGALSITQPANQTKAVGESATFSVVATGTGSFTYQWRFNETNIISDATNASYTLSSVQTNHAGSYTVEVGNGTCSTMSNPAVLTVGTSPQPFNITGVTVQNGTALQITWDSATGQNYTIQYKNDLGDATWTDLTNATATGSSSSQTDAISGARRFYRIATP